MANSSMFVLPRITTPAWRNRRVTVASYGGRQPSRIREPHVVGMSAVVNTSLSASGTPARGEAGGSPRCRHSSTAAAAASAPSASRCRKACTAGSTAAIRSRCALTTSTALVSRVWMRLARSAAGN
jgi:hypothetical protein